MPTNTTGKLADGLHTGNDQFRSKSKVTESSMALLAADHRILLLCVTWPQDGAV